MTLATLESTPSPPRHAFIKLELIPPPSRLYQAELIPPYQAGVDPTPPLQTGHILWMTPFRHKGNNLKTDTRKQLQTVKTKGKN